MTPEQAGLPPEAPPRRYLMTGSIGAPERAREVLEKLGAHLGSYDLENECFTDCDVTVETFAKLERFLASPFVAVSGWAEFDPPEWVFSASQVETFGEPSPHGRTGCIRKWAYKYIEGISEPETESQRFGKRLHKVQELWLRDGTPPNNATREGKLALGAIPHLPAPGTPGLEVERKFIRRIGGIKWLGYKDFQLPGTVGDHKTTSDLKYAKTEDELRHGIQGILYSADYQAHFDADKNALDWIYYLKKSERTTKRVHVVVYRSDVDARMVEINAVAREILAIVSTPGVRATDLPANEAICPTFGGCAHRERCFPTEHTHQERLISPMSLDDVRAQMAAQKARNQAAAAPPPVVAPAPAPAAAPAAAPAFQGFPGAAVVVPPPIVADAPTKTISVAPSAGMTMRQRLDAQKSKGNTGVNPPPVKPKTPPPAPPEVEAAGEPRRIGRPPGSKNKPKTGSPPTPPPGYVMAMVPVAQVSPAPQAAPLTEGLVPRVFDQPVPAEMRPTRHDIPAQGAPPSAHAPSGKQGFKLLVNTLPSGDPSTLVIPLSKLLEPVHEMIRGGTGAAHYKVIDYGKGPGWLAAYLEAWLQENPLGSHIEVTLDIHTPEGADAFSVLEKYARKVYRGY